MAHNPEGSHSCCAQHASHEHDLISDHGEEHTHSTYCTHHHVDVESASGSRLLITLGLNFIIPVAQVIGGIYAGSVALISDATHNFSDFTAILVAYFAYLIGRKGASPRNTFGYQRAEVLAACFNIVILMGAAGFIIYEALHRFHHPQAVSGKLVMLIAGIGVVGNGFSAWLLHRDAKHSLNVRGAFLHMLGDLLTSVVVLVNGLILVFKPWYWLDPLLSLVIVLFILKNCWSILKEAGVILMNATPKGLDIQKIRTFLEDFPGICNVHYLHAWNVSASSIAFSCHVVVDDQPVSQTAKMAEAIRAKLSHHFGIDHPILQFETDTCGNGGLLCEMSCATPQGSGQAIEVSSVKKRSLLNNPISFWVRLILGAVFIFASFDKAIHPAAFAQAIYNYQILPDTWINLTAIVLPWMELVLGVLLILGVWLPGAVLLANLLLVSFFGALLFNMARGLNVHCGCFTTGTGGTPTTTWYVVRDSIFLLFAGYLLWEVIIRPTSK